VKEFSRDTSLNIIVLWHTIYLTWVSGVRGLRVFVHTKGKVETFISTFLIFLIKLVKVNLGY